MSAYAIIEAKYLQNGFRGTEAEIRQWAEERPLTGPLYHYSDDREAVMREGFQLRLRDGIYFMDNPGELADWKGGKPIVAYIAGPVADTAAIKLTDEQREQVRDEFGTDDVRALMEVDTLGDFLRSLGYAGWTDGTQHAALDPDAVAILDDPVTESLEGARGHVDFKDALGNVTAYPMLISRNTIPGEKPYRLTFFYPHNPTMPADHLQLDTPDVATAQEVLRSCKAWMCDAESATIVTESADDFTSWFAGSQVVDEHGRPRRVYHGTNQPFDEFSKGRAGQSTKMPSSRAGFFFTDDPQTASEYADLAAERVIPDVSAHNRRVAQLKRNYDRLERLAQRSGNDQHWRWAHDALEKWERTETDALQAEPAGANVRPAYLQLRNPLIIDAKGGVMSAGDVMQASTRAKRAGHDGLVIQALRDAPQSQHPSTHYVVFRPDQVRTAIGARVTEGALGRCCGQVRQKTTMHRTRRCTRDATVRRGDKCYCGAHDPDRQHMSDHTARDARRRVTWMTRYLRPKVEESAQIRYGWARGEHVVQIPFVDGEDNHHISNENLLPDQDGGWKRWRYNGDLDTIFWWEAPTKQERDAVAADIHYERLASGEPEHRYVELRSAYGLKSTKPRPGDRTGDLHRTAHIDKLPDDLRGDLLDVTHYMDAPTHRVASWLSRLGDGVSPVDVVSQLLG